MAVFAYIIHKNGGGVYHIMFTRQFYLGLRNGLYVLSTGKDMGNGVHPNRLTTNQNSRKRRSSRIKIQLWLNFLKILDDFQIVITCYLLIHCV